MDHLVDEFGPIEVTVDLVTKSEHCTPINSLADFYAFPEKNGWSVAEEEDYGLNELDKLDGVTRRDKADLLQSWLFFGLIYLVVRNADGPILTFERLHNKNKYLNTSSLPEALQDWEAWELQNKDTAKIRMIRTELALEYAHRIVRKNCAAEIDEPEYTKSISPDQPDFVGDKLSLSLMVLGETLSAAKAKIMNLLGVKMDGWHKANDGEGGWGPPGYVLKRMKSSNWCPRSTYLLRGQLGSNATLLLAAFESHKTLEDNLDKDLHKKSGCTKEICKVISEGDSTEYPALPGSSQDGNISRYSPRHDSECPGDCAKIGPNMTEVYEILKEQNDNNKPQNFPILEIKVKADKTLEMVPRSWTPKTTFATISHVWSDGLGNEEQNKIYYCQFRFISRLLTKVVNSSQNWNGSSTATIPFWMDTLLIPVHDKESTENPPPAEYDELKKRAIRQIYHVFNESAHSIIIDRGLLSTDANVTPWKTVMKILASGWMRRLWTLQEAYLSKHLWVSFKQGESHTARAGMEDFDELIGEVKGDNLSSSIAEAAKLKLFHNVMGYERHDRNRGVDPISSGKGAILVANTWRAACWRTTSNPAHETLALATLLNLDYRNTSLNQAGLTGRMDKISNDRLNQMMCDFWKTIDKQLPRSIPPGVIFLPGEKLSQAGFRWAPKTWMSAHGIEHPDPLSTFNHTTELVDQGLLVQYPGFLLHCEDRNLILGTNSIEPAFTFPIDGDLMEWYSVEPADKERKPYVYQYLEQSNGKPNQLAIILSRSRPREMPPEIGLLVEIYEEQSRHKEGDRKRMVYCCRIIHRIRAWRAKPLYGHGRGHSVNTNAIGTIQRRNTKLANKDAPSILEAPSTRDGEICIGELIKSDQMWYVDAFEPPEESKPQNTGMFQYIGQKVQKLSLLWTKSPKLPQPPRDASNIPPEESQGLRSP